MMVTNKAQVEGSIVEATIIETLLVFDKVERPLGRGKARILDENEYKAAHNYVLFNSPETISLLE
jgi:hypothetical protein